ncbi:MAG: prolyl oligopeptidase family serine peptidase [Propionibacteriaceae bacterium]|nr:prolyl oligopeptidase family serine peptidase [Propionibacteriaceae bacterium]
MIDATPYGSWPSPIGPELLTAGQVGLAEVLVDGADVYWLEARADQGGRISLWRESDGERTEITPEHYVRTTVHEYGGGAFDVADGIVVFSSFPDSVVRAIRSGADPVALTDGSKRYAGLRVHPDHDLVLAIREDHTVLADGAAQPAASIVAISLSRGTETVLVSGADFYAGATLSAQGDLAWVEWQHPNMPWDTTAVRTGRLVGDAGSWELTDITTVAHTEDVSVVHPAWFPDGRLLYLSDDSGFWNFQVFDGTASEPLLTYPADFCGPSWQLVRPPFAVLNDERVLCTWLERGIAQLGCLQDGQLEPLPTHQVSVDGLAASAQRTAAILGYATRPREVVEILRPAGETVILRVSATVDLDPAYLSTAQPISVGTPPVHAWYYPPTNPLHHGPADELPPLRVLSHGGPTAFSPPALRLEYQYWTSRGYAVVDVNYGGSTGYGRAYRDRLKGQWGIVDVADCVLVAHELAVAGMGDPLRTYIEGGSAGGYTTLRALTSTDAFAAGISYFGIGDLAALARDTHKFESRYLEGLIGRWPEDADVYADRSPIHHLDQLAAPMLILQGTEDRVVPPNQAETMAEAVRAKGLACALVLFEGEGHGFRKAESIHRSLEASQAFLGSVFGFTPADVEAGLGLPGE